MAERNLTDVCGLIEIDGDGYPTDDSMARFKAFEWTGRAADFFLVHEFPDLMSNITFARIETEDTVDGFNKDICRIIFATGGWSGCEEIIGTMLSQFWIKHRHTVWKRGGYYEFEVPIVPHNEGIADGGDA